MSSRAGSIRSASCRRSGFSAPPRSRAAWTLGAPSSCSRFRSPSWQQDRCSWSAETSKRPELRELLDGRDCLHDAAREEADRVATAVGELHQPHVFAEVDRVAIVESRSNGKRQIDGSAVREAMLDGVPVGSVVDMAEDVDVGHPQRPCNLRRVTGRVRQYEGCRGAPPTRRFGVGIEPRPDTCRPRIRPEMDPDAVHLDLPTAVALERPSPPGGQPGEAAAPGGDDDRPVVEARGNDVDPDRAEHPQVLRRAPTRLLDIIGGRILEIARDRVESQPTSCIHVREANTGACPEDPARARLWDEWLHDGAPYARSRIILPRPSPGSWSTYPSLTYRRFTGFS